MTRKPEIEVADIFRRYADRYQREDRPNVPSRHKKVITAITSCRTARLGGHKETCESCGYVRISYNSCRDRHCPKCQFLKKEQWVCDRNKDLLPVQYFHVVFTVPNDLAFLMYCNQQRLYALLMKCAGETIVELGKDPRYLGVHTGAICVLHTWGQTLQLHPHVHTIVPGGGVSPDNTHWISCKKDFFLPVIVLSKRFRGKFLDALKVMYANHELSLTVSLEHLQKPVRFQHLIDELYANDWVVYAKPSFRTVGTVIEYLARYTHRIAISNYRILKCEDGRVSFRYRDYRDNNSQKVMSLQAVEFMRRFLLHVLPKRFVRIRYVGLLANRVRSRNIRLCRQLLKVKPEDVPEPVDYTDFADFLRELTGLDLSNCLLCSGPMIVAGTIEAVRCSRLSSTSEYRKLTTTRFLPSFFSQLLILAYKLCPLGFSGNVKGRPRKMRYHFRENIRRNEEMVRTGLKDWAERHYGGINLHDFSSQEFLELAMPKLSFATPNPAALELGTGVGPGAIFLAERGFQVTGYDLIPEAIRAAKELASDRSLSIRYEVMDVT